MRNDNLLHLQTGPKPVPTTFPDLKSGRTPHCSMVRPALSRRPVHVFLFCASASLIAASWWLAVSVGPLSRTGCLCVTSPPQWCCRGGGQGTQPLAQSSFLVGKEGYFFQEKKICCHPLEGGTINPAFLSVLELQRQTWRGDCPLFVVLFSTRKALAAQNR